jgi:hypothetical protein
MVIATIKNSVVWTVSDSGYVEGEKPSREAKTAKSAKQLPECTAVGRPLAWEEIKVERKVIKAIENYQV